MVILFDDKNTCTNQILIIHYRMCQAYFEDRHSLQGRAWFIGRIHCISTVLISSRRGKFTLIPSPYTLFVHWINNSFKIHVVASLEIFKNVKLLGKWQQSVFRIKFGLRCIYGNNGNIKSKVARKIISVKKVYAKTLSIQ